MAALMLEVRYAWRRWIARPGLAVTVVLTLGLDDGHLLPG